MPIEYRWPPGAPGAERVWVSWPDPAHPHVPYRFAALCSDQVQDAACATCHQPISRTGDEPWAGGSGNAECPGRAAVKVEVSQEDLRVFFLWIGGRAFFNRDGVAGQAEARLRDAAKTGEWR